jgi:hypothetical protein
VSTSGCVPPSPITSAFPVFECCVLCTCRMKCSTVVSVSTGRHTVSVLCVLFSYRTHTHSSLCMLRPNLEFVPIRIGIRVWMSKCHPVPVWDGKITIVFSHYVHRVTAVGRSCMTVRCWIVTTVRCWIVTLVLE